jgi:hypothetical protein
VRRPNAERSGVEGWTGAGATADGAGTERGTARRSAWLGAADGATLETREREAPLSRVGTAVDGARDMAGALTSPVRERGAAPARSGTGTPALRGTA